MAEPSDFRHRQRAAALSLWQLGDLLGIHPHQLPDGVAAPNLAHLPVGVLIDLARQLDLHPADLVPGIDAVLTNHRLDPDDPPEPTDNPNRDALTVLTALATAAAPLSIDDLAAALRWPPERVQASVDHTEDNPQLGGPLALRRAAPHTYTVGPRLDVLTRDQRTDVLNTARHTDALTIDQANVLFAAMLRVNDQHADEPDILTNQPKPQHATWRRNRAATERELRASGILHADHKPASIEVNPEVLYSLRWRSDPTGF